MHETSQKTFTDSLLTIPAPLQIGVGGDNKSMVCKLATIEEEYD